VLYDQYDNAGTNATSSQNFEAGFDAFDDELADDFVVPSGDSWDVNQVDVAGVYFNGPGPVNSVNVVFYNNSSGLPGSVVATRNGLSVTDSAGSFVIPIPSAVTLGPGTYWVSVQANMDFGCCGQWGWTDRTVQSTSAAAWRNPGGGFGVCPSWGTRHSTCGIDPGVPDQVYRLSGTSGGGGPTHYTISTQTGQSLTPGVTDIGNHCDDCTTEITFPFPVYVYGQQYTTGTIESNGTIQFNSTNVQFGNTCLPASSYERTFFPYWDDLRTDGTGEGIFTTTTGSAPNRVFYIEWRTEYFGQGGVANFEAVFNENDQVLKTIYGETTNAGSSSTEGVQDTSTGIFDEYGCIGAGGRSPKASQ